MQEEQSKGKKESKVNCSNLLIRMLRVFVSTRIFFLLSMMNLECSLEEKSNWCFAINLVADSRGDFGKRNKSGGDTYSGGHSSLLTKA